MFSISLFIKKYTIPFFVFVTGACILIIEILATRVLAPYFGNTIFALSSVISIVLLALCSGYFFGGKLADKYPKEKLFYALVALSGCCVIILHVVGIIFLAAFGYRLSIEQGPIIASLLLFFVQNFFLGMLSPFAIKLQATRLQNMGIGSVSGGIFFWSTLGSIVGSLGARFFLIPNFGIDRIMLTVGALLITLGLFSMLKVSVWLRIFLAIIFLSLAAWYINYVVSSINAAYAKAGIYTYDGVYQKITVYNGQYNNQPARFLMQDRNPSAAEFINSPELAYPYTKYYALYQIFNPHISQALMIGAGAYSVPKALLNDVPNVHINVAEIEPSLKSLGQKYFGVPSSPRLQTITEDGRRLLEDSSKKYDYIFSDAYSSSFSTPSHLVTLQFFTIAKQRLNNNGIFIANVIGSLSATPPSLFLSEVKTFKTVFPNSYFFAVSSPTSNTLQNIIFVGYNSSNTIDLNSPTITRNKNEIISNLTKQQISLSAYNFSLYPTLTDDYSPTEYLTALEFEKSNY